MPGLITLKSYVEGGHEVTEARILVCVKSIGGRKKCKLLCSMLAWAGLIMMWYAVATKKGGQAEKVDVNVFDDTADATLTLWGAMCGSSAAWRPSYTVLLISQPLFRGDWRPNIGLKPGTHVDVDPLINDAIWLRGHAQRLTKREHVNQAFPDGGRAFLCLYG